jgi:hypothetical protein
MSPDTWSTVFLGVIAFSTLALAAGAVAAAVYAARAAQRLERALTQLREDIRPLIGRVTVVTEDTARITTLVAAQVERADSLIAEFGQRVDDVVTIVQHAIVAPAREGMAVMAAARAVFDVLRGLKSPRGPSSRAEEEDALFIG